MSIKSYSQRDEQEVILRLFNALPTGRLLDIGAYRPDTFSNTRALLDQGWCGVLVEPSPGPFLSLLDHYGDNPNVQLVNAAITKNDGLVEFFDARGDAVSSTDAEHVKRWSKHSKFRTFFTRGLTLSDLMGHVGIDLDFINIDVEGQNFWLLQEFVTNHLVWRATLKVICIEHDSRVHEMANLVGAFKFKLVHTTAENAIFCRS